MLQYYPILRHSEIVHQLLVYKSWDNPIPSLIGPTKSQNDQSAGLCLQQEKLLHPDTLVMLQVQYLYNICTCSSIETSALFELVCIDYLHLDKLKRAEEHIDHFTKYAHTYATRDKSGKTTARKLFDDFIMCFGFPSKTHHDQGK